MLNRPCGSGRFFGFSSKGKRRVTRLASVPLLSHAGGRVGAPHPRRGTRRGRMLQMLAQVQHQLGLACARTATPPSQR